jgi:cytochrome c553
MKKTWLALTLIFSVTGLHAETTHAGLEKAASCASCHGEQGNSMVSTFPKLAQQHESYLIKQLQAFKNGSRKNAMMSSIAMTLSDDDMADIAAYYASQTLSKNAPPLADDEDDVNAPEKLAALIEQGADLYRNGDLTREVSACIACHGPLGEGNKPAAFPALRGQHADYLIQALTDFKAGKRGNTPDNMMHMIATKMTNDQIKAVAYRISMMNH